jgi:hypothetical protein
VRQHDSKMSRRETLQANEGEEQSVQLKVPDDVGENIKMLGKENDFLIAVLNV